MRLCLKGRCRWRRCKCSRGRTESLLAGAIGNWTMDWDRENGSVGDGDGDGDGDAAAKKSLIHRTYASARISFGLCLSTT